MGSLRHRGSARCPRRPVRLRTFHTYPRSPSLPHNPPSCRPISPEIDTLRQRKIRYTVHPKESVGLCCRAEYCMEVETG